MGRAARRKLDAREKARSPSSGNARGEAGDASGEVGVSPSTRWQPPGWWSGAALALEVLGYLILKCYGLHPHRVDEGIYFYDAARLVDGASLYKDIFFAHPPLQLLLPYLILRTAGFSLLALKCLSPLAGAAQGVLAFFIARRVFASGLAGVVAAGALLYARDFLLSTCYFTGINEADALLYGAVLLLLYRRWAMAGVVAGASVMTLLQTAPVVALLGISVIAWDARDGFERYRAQSLRFVLGFAAVFVGVHLYFAVTAGGDFFNQVYLYHLHKTASESAGPQQLGFLIVENALLFVGGALALGLATLGLEERPHPRRFLQAAAAATVLQTLVMVSQPRVFPFYFQPAFTLLALALGWAAAQAWRRVRESTQVGGGVALGIAVLIAPGLLATPITETISPRRAEQRRTYAQTYDWRDAPLLGSLNGVVRSLLFSDGTRAAGSAHSSATEYLWNQSRAFDSYLDIVNAVRDNSPVDGTLFGDSGSLPLVALGARRRIIADFADTNAQRFASGTTPVDAAVADLEQRGGPTLILTAGNAGFFSLPGFQRYVADKYQPIQHFSDRDGTRYSLYARRP